MMFKYCLCCNTVCAPLVKCVILSINISALCYFNGSFNSFENILHSKTCQSYSWMTLSNIISLVILMGCHAIFFSRHFVPNCTVTLLSDGVTIVHWNNWSGSTSDTSMTPFMGHNFLFTLVILRMFRTWFNDLVLAKRSIKL